MANKNNIKQIINDSRHLSSYEERLSFLHNKFEGQTCYILACGPSLKDIDKAKLVNETKSNCLFTIKQSYFSFKDYVDFHFFNSNNYMNYPNNRNAFFVGSSDWDSESIIRAMFWKYQQVDICTSVFGRKPLGAKQYDENFEGLEPYTFKNSGLKRHWGAGIMFENVLFFAMHLGFKNIKTIGWDYIDIKNDNKHTHFYEESKRSNLINPADDPYEKEFEDSINMARVFAEYFRSNGIEIKCHESDKCFLPEEIERYKL